MSLWSDYCKGSVDETVSEKERMIAPTLESYMWVGKSAARCIAASHLMADGGSVTRVLDFGCGHGRVARHLRVLFPSATIFAADIRSDGVQFCAERLQCEPIVLEAEFGKTVLPHSLDLVFVGSVFTHVDYSRQRRLWSWLFGALGPKGILVATFHGRKARQAHDEGHLRLIAQDKWEQIISQHDLTGVGYASYGLAELGDWGVSLNTVRSMVELPVASSSNRLVAVAEYGWSNLQDVVSWQKT